MRFAARVLLCLLCCFGVACWGAVGTQASAHGLTPGGPGGAASVVPSGSPERSAVSGVASSASVLASSLVVAGVQELDDGEQVQAVEEARLSSPVVALARERSHTAFEHLGAVGARGLAGRMFPTLVDEPAGGAPSVPAGQRLGRYTSDDSVQVDLPGARHGMIESLQPIATQVSPGRFAALDLSLSEVGGVFEPKTALVSVRIPQRLQQGVVLTGSGVSLTPVDGRGRDLADSEGTLDGASVVYANTLLDSDTLAKPTADGFELDSLLRSVDSPQTLDFRIGLPTGARLTSSGADASVVRVVEHNATIAIISAPSAFDAEGVAVPVSLSVSGEVVSVHVADHSGDYGYPILVDPTVEENVNGEGKVLIGKTWGFYNADDPSAFKQNGTTDEIQESATAEGAPLGTYADFYYKTQGESKIYSLTATTSFGGEGSSGRYIENVLGIFDPQSKSLEREQAWIGAYGPTTTTLCTVENCETGGVNQQNDESEAVFKQSVREDRESSQGKWGTPVSSLSSAKIGIVQEAGPKAAWDSTDSTRGDHENGLFPGRWVDVQYKEQRPNAALWLDAFDPGVGLVRESWSSPSAPGWGEEVLLPDADGAAQRPECEETRCGGEPREIKELAKLPEGEDTVDASVEDGVGLKATASGVIKVDNAAPYDLRLSGPSGTNNEVGRGHVRLAASATDGTGSTPSSGVASIALYIDGVEVGHPNGSCSPGPCTATGEWYINGEEYAAGRHSVRIEATDYAGNVANPAKFNAEETYITFGASESKSVGPGSVNLSSGAFTLDSTDVAVAAPGSSLTVERSYNSRLIGASNEGPFGPQWQGLSFTGTQKLTKATDGVIFTATSGQSVLFAKEGTSLVPPAGDAGLTLKEESSGSFKLTDLHGDVTTFTVPEGGSGSVLTPSSREEPGVTGKERYTFRTTGGVTEPVQVVAPVPAGVSCTTLVKGCRALSFTYASHTTAGETPETWGEYAGRLMQVSLTAYNPAKSEMQTLVVAQYAYDGKGRLRAEWNPRITPALKTVYGYDAEGHVTAVSPPGEQPWLLRYGTSEHDPTSGRLLSVTRPSAATKLGSDIAPVIGSEAPKLSKSNPGEGEEVTVSTGQWSNEPLSYSYQWERCSSTDSECAVIPGATDQEYTLRYGDEERTLAVLVTATNAGGSTTTSTAVSAVVPYTVLTPAYAGSVGEKYAREPSPMFNDPTYVASTLNFWRNQRLFVTDTGDDRVGELNVNGEPLGWLGSAGSGEEQFEQPTGLSAPYPGELVVADSGNKRLCSWSEQERSGYSSSDCATVEGNGALGGISPDYLNGDEEPGQFVAVDGEASKLLSCTNWWLCQGEGLRSLGSKGSGPGQVINPAGVSVPPVGGPTNSPVDDYMYVVDTGNDRVEYFSDAPEHFGEYLGQFGEPGSGPGQLKEPKGIAVDSRGDVWVVDSGNGRVEVFSPTGVFKRAFGEKAARTVREEKEKKVHEEEEKEAPKQRKNREKREAKEKQKQLKREEKEHKNEPGWEREKEEKEMGPGQLNRPTGIAIESEGAYGWGPYEGERVYVADSGDDRLVKWDAGKRPAEPALPPATPPSPGSSAVWTIDYEVPVSGTTTGAPNLSVAEIGRWGQQEQQAPVEATAIFPPDEPMGWPAKDYRRASIFYVSNQGHTVNTAAPGGGITTTEYNSSGDVVRTLSADNRVQVLDKGPSSAGELDNKSTYSSEGTELQSKTGPEHTVKLANGETITARKSTKYSYDEGAPSEGGPYAEVTKQTTAAQDMNKGGEEEDMRTTTTSYSGEGGLGWRLRKPTAVTADSGGLGLEHMTSYEPETGNVIETRQPANPAEKSPHATETIYYSAGTNSRSSACGSHPEWAGLVCQTRPAKQPETTGLPNLPVSTITRYNVWDEPELTEEIVGASTRTKSITYDAAGRMTASTTTATGAAAMSDAYEYSPETGALVSESSEGRKITSVHNTLGQLVSYTDADGAQTTYTYDIDGRPHQTNDEKGTETYIYNETTGLASELVNEYGTTKLVFTAKYDPEGNMLEEGYPNGMSAKYTYNAVDEPTTLEYVKTTHCTTGCTWFSDSIVPSIEGQWMSQTSTYASENYSYDGAGRLTQVQTTPAGKGCTTLIYGYDRDTNRTSTTAREPGSGGKCATEGGTTETHHYDEADRLIDSGIAYNAFGDITSLPEADADGPELTNTYYADNQLQSMTQHETKTEPEETIGYKLDPAGRTREIIATGKLENTDTINHFAGPGTSPAWTTNPAGSEWSRDVPGINGQLAATQSNGETPVLQLANLHGDIIATASLSETATKLASTIGEATPYGAYGIPATEAPPKYAWLGAIELPTELPSGVISMGARSYIPQLGRFLQPDPRPGGSANAYTYTFGNPLNTTDPSGEATEYAIGGPSAALIAWSAQASAQAAAQQAAENAAARAAAERLAAEQAAAEQAAYGPLDEEEWEEWGEEEGGYEEIAYKDGSGKEQAQIEPAVLYQPLNDGEASAFGSSSVVPRCEVEEKEPCARSASAHRHRRITYRQKGGQILDECEYLRRAEENRHSSNEAKAYAEVMCKKEMRELYEREWYMEQQGVEGAASTERPPR